jgi:branched-subunit amino acid transport protein
MAEEMKIWLVILAAGLVTFGTRLSFIFLLERIRVPGWFQRSLRFVPVAVLSAIILPELASRNGIVDISLSNPQLLSGAVAILVAWRTKNVLLTILAGMAALLILQALAGL